MFETERNQPMRVCAAASGFSHWTLAISNGMSTNPMPSSSAELVRGARPRRSSRCLARRCGGARRSPCRSCRGRPRSAPPRRCAGSRAGRRPRASIAPSPARPAPSTSRAASSAKSHFDLRPKPPPSSVTLTVTLSSEMPSVLATSSRVPPGLCTGAQISALSPLTSATATGGSMLTWARCGQIIFADDHLVGALQRAFDVAFLAHDEAGLARGLLELGAVGDRVVFGIGAIVPDDLQRVAALDRRAGIARDHGHAAERLEFRRPRPALDLHDLLDAGDLHAPPPVERDQLAAGHRRPRDHGILHAGQAHVRAVTAPCRW